jgi:hypothetical protein
MVQKLSHAAQPTERRSALWPWLAMPLAALAMFLTLWRVRHATEGVEAAGPTSEAARAQNDQ